MRRGYECVGTHILYVSHTSLNFVFSPTIMNVSIWCTVQLSWMVHDLER